MIAQGGDIIMRPGCGSAAFVRQPRHLIQIIADAAERRDNIDIDARRWCCDGLAESAPPDKNRDRQSRCKRGRLDGRGFSRGQAQLDDALTQFNRAWPTPLFFSRCVVITCSQNRPRRLG